MVTSKHTLFTGSTRTLKTGINMYDAYTVGSAASIGRSSTWSGKAGLIIPTNNLKLCKNALTEVLAADEDIVMKDIIGRLTANFKNF